MANDDVVDVRWRGEEVEAIWPHQSAPRLHTGCEDVLETCTSSAFIIARETRATKVLENDLAV